ncbi:3-hydroxyisobutyryl-coenzyme A hydrolase isoform 1 [Mycena floridula]|nr:3-hydroxyisobutyryl-coenzyme A hydrolase isoform 1 [Mycena floridula]
MFSTLRGMTRRATAINRTQIIARHMTGSKTIPTSKNMQEADQEPVLFHSNFAARHYILNKPEKLNSLNQQMLDILRPKVEEWVASDLVRIIIASGTGRAFCAGGDIESVVLNAENPETRHKAINFFKREFEMDYMLAGLKKVYVAVMDGITMGGGVGLSSPAPFRIATEKTDFAMPETKIGYCPDVGGNYYLSRLEGELGTYLALTGARIKGRAVFELGIATHYMASARIPHLLEALSALGEDVQDPFDTVNSTIEEFSSERESDEPEIVLSGQVREALDVAFAKNTVEGIFTSLERFTTHDNSLVRDWATETLESLHLRSPTSLKVALKAIRLGKSMSLAETLKMEMKIATAFCNGASPDFKTGVTHVLIEKSKDRALWNPSTYSEVTDEIVARFFDSSEYLAHAPVLDLPGHKELLGNTFGLPTQQQIKEVIQGVPPLGGSMGMTFDELLQVFDEHYQGKLGVTKKVTEVVARRCDVVDNSDGNFVWLRWRDSAPEGK